MCMQSFLGFVRQSVSAHCCVCVCACGRGTGQAREKGFPGALQPLQTLYSVFQLQVSILLSNVFKLLMTHKVRSGWRARPLVRQEGRDLGKAGGLRVVTGTFLM